MTSSDAALQPAIHHLVACIHAPSVTLSDPDGRITGAGVEGCFLGERRLLCEHLLTVADRAPEPLDSRLDADGALHLTAIVRDGSEPTPDPTLLLRRTRRAHAAGFTETLELRNSGVEVRVLEVVLSTAADFTPTSTIKEGQPGRPRQHPTEIDGGVAFAHDGYEVHVTATPAPVAEVRPGSGRLRWQVTVPPASSWWTTIEVRGSQPDDQAFRPVAATTLGWSAPTVVASDATLATLVQWGFADLAHLALADPLAPDDTFIAAGSPWYFTLFGRDSLWTARFLLPFGTGIAASTLRTLARRQGTRVDQSTAEQPGRILHELRPAAPEVGDMRLPPAYYGSVDSTPLWITTLVEAWRWGLADDEVVALLPSLQAAVGWLLEYADADGDGLCEYIDGSGHGLSNQGWKDSGDSVHWHDGTLAAPPIALIEVQGYAYAAALDAAELYAHFGLDGGERLREFAARLHDAFHRSFWVADPLDPGGVRLAVALDADKRAVDATTSNPGHLLGTGLLSADQEALVVERLMDRLACPVGLRTLSDHDARYNPLSYHNGSIWPHDTAIVARGMVLAGHPEAAAVLLRGLTTASTWFDGRLPELYASIDDVTPVAPYPASCRPQAWAAAVGAVALWACAPLVPGARGTAPRVLTGARLAQHLEIDAFTVAGRAVPVVVDGGIATFTGLAT